MFARLSSSIALAALGYALASCGGGGNSGGSVVATSTPAAPQPATPAPPSPPPPTPPPAGPTIAQVAPGGTLSGSIVCAAGDFRYEATADGGRRLADITRIGATDPTRTSIAIAYRSANFFQVDVNGFGGPAFTPSNVKSEHAGSNWPMVYFRKAPEQQYVDELEINDGNGPMHPLVNVTLGRLSDGYSLCFFAAGSDRAFTGASTRDLYVVADGLGVFGGTARRIGASTALAKVDATARTIDLSLDISAHTPPFGLPVATTNLGRVSSRLSFTANGAVNGMLTGPGGSTGTIVGRMYENGSGAGLVFNLTYPNGDQVFGAIAADIF